MGTGFGGVGRTRAWRPNQTVIHFEVAGNDRIRACFARFIPTSIQLNDQAQNLAGVAKYLLKAA
ncbi:MAG: hypothetical protein EBS01_10455 [Verrucomicrobia bacterium]|nr:hypothetical protein [Verrucomicrobiota bacterium]